MLRMRIADVSPLHGHGVCNYLGVYGQHLPLWSRPINTGQTRSQTKLLRVQMLFPLTLGSHMEQYDVSGRSPFTWENRFMLG